MIISPVDMEMLLEAVTREQYESVIKDIGNQRKNNPSPMSIRNIRNTITYKQIFGNHQRLKFDIKNDVSEDIDSKSEYDDNTEFKEYYDDIAMIMCILADINLNIYYNLIAINNNKQFFTDYYNNTDLTSSESSKTIFSKFIETVPNFNEVYSSPYNLNTILQIKKCAYDWINNKFKYLLNIQNKPVLKDFKVSTGCDKMIADIKKLNIISPLIIKDIDNSIKYDIKRRHYNYDYKGLIPLLTDIKNKQQLKMENIPDGLINELSITEKNNYFIILSRYPADVMSMSTGQGWTSCQDLNKNNYHGDYMTAGYSNKNWHLKYDVALGTCIAYLITEKSYNQSINDYKNTKKNKKGNLFPLEHSICRFLIKPFYNKDKTKVYLSPGSTPLVYGTPKYKGEMINTIKNYLESKQSNISGEFYLPADVYWDPIFDGIVKNHIIVENGKVKSSELDDEMNIRDPKENINWNDLIKNNFNTIKSVFTNDIAKNYLNKSVELYIDENSNIGVFDYNDPPILNDMLRQCVIKDRIFLPSFDSDPIYVAINQLLNKKGINDILNQLDKNIVIKAVHSIDDNKRNFTYKESLQYISNYCEDTEMEDLFSLLTVYFNDDGKVTEIFYKIYQGMIKNKINAYLSEIKSNIEHNIYTNNDFDNFD